MRLFDVLLVLVEYVLLGHYAVRQECVPTMLHATGNGDWMKSILYMASQDLSPYL